MGVQHRRGYEMTGPGRPRKEAAERRDSHVSARLTEQEYVMLDKFAWAEGITPSSAIRWLVAGCLSDGAARAMAIDAGNAWMDSDSASKVHQVADCAAQFKEEACKRMARELTDNGDAE